MLIYEHMREKKNISKYQLCVCTQSVNIQTPLAFGHNPVRYWAAFENSPFSHQELLPFI